MGMEKQGSKGGGGYVGGFLQLFDWNGKSRKKLFSNKSDFPDGSKQGKRSDGNFPITRLHLTNEDDNGRSSIKGSSDYSCASSVTDDEGNGTKAPGVVARLMGLDSLPTSGVIEPFSTPFFDSRCLRDAHYQRTPEFLYNHQIIHSGNQPTKLDSFSRNPVESRPQKTLNRPIERFQTEILPPKSAKSIPITHHKLLSPIKSPGFIPTKNAAQIMEEAAKIIVPRPQASTKGKMSHVSSSVPLKFRDLKEKMEAVQRTSRLPEASRKPVESKAAKYLKGQSMNKSWNGVEDEPHFRASPYPEESNSVGLKNKGKSVSLAIQAKVNVQRREGLSSGISKSLMGQKEENEFKGNQTFKSQLNTQKNMQKKPSTLITSGVLRQNNQKQNRLTNRDKLPSKPSVPNQQGRKTLSGDASSGRSKTLNKVAGNSKAGSRKTSLDTNDIEKVVPVSRTQNFPRKKRSIEGDFHFEKSAFVDTVAVNKDEEPIQPNVAIDGNLKWAEDNRRKGTDVVSFTFTSPMIKCMPGSHSSGRMVEKHSFCLGSHNENVLSGAKNLKLNSLGLDAIRGDTLSILLEQKLRELTYGVESSHSSSVKSGSVATYPCILQDLVSDSSAVSSTPRESSRRSQLGLQKDKLSTICDFNCFSTDGHKLQGVEGMEYSSNSSEARKKLDCRNPSPVSILEPSFSNESCNSSDSGDSNSMNGGRQCLSLQTQDLVNSNYIEKLLSIEVDTDLCDSASSTSIRNVSGEHKWELEYVKEILSDAELRFEDFTLGRTREIINLHLFDQLENRKIWTRIDYVENNNFRLRRKVLFDCVRECLDLRCRRYIGGGCQRWAKGVLMMGRKEELAREVYKEISGWRSMGDWMLDELVDKDMSTQYGKWLDFEIEEFDLGAEIGRSILSSLVDEVVDDILLV